MLTRSLAAALAICITGHAAPKRKVPMIRATLEASVTFGPGREPQPGAPPFQPVLEISVAFAEPPPRDLRVLCWLVPAAASGDKAPASVKGARRLRHEVLRQAEKRFDGRADWPRDLRPEGWRVAVAFSAGRARGSASAPIQVHYLPAAPPRGHRDQEH
ncbi:MAG: hypothetical protein IPL96_04540 [Holophagaceae bacterium]|nr:hypothetical protein [Holophagaceae bacterium]